MRRRAEVIKPDQNRNSNARLASDQSHHGSERRGSPSSNALAGIGPSSATVASTSSTSSGRSRATRFIPPQASSWARCMRQRSNGCVATGSSDAS